LWIELTSKCPFDCIFCSRKTRRGSGQHLPFDTYAHLVNELVDTSKFLLNYSGESTVYPELIPAIRLARSTGATVELVSALATAPESLLAPLAASGLDRLTVSVHATDPQTFAAIYRHSSFEMLKTRLERFLELSRRMPDPPVVDLAFVAIDSNLAQLGPVAAFARRLKLHDIFLFPVMRRDEIPVRFPSELTVFGGHRPDFRRRVRAAVSDAERQYPEIGFTICNEAFETEERRLGEVPVRFPGPLPAGARIYSCEQNPWETTHVLANGDVVACEVLDRYPLGNLLEQSMA
jgi:MoaA/NifB/PqqE/SkfB family radical SAM enzyme